MDEVLEKREPVEEVKTQEREYERFDLSQRIEHLILLISFSILGITGLAQKFATSPAGEFVLALFGGIEQSRRIHRATAVVLLAVSIYHLVAVLYRMIVLRHRLTMLPVPQDFQHLYHDVLYYLGKRVRKAYYGRYSYAEKAEYLAVVWGTVIMAITGFMMWNPIATARWLPGEIIPAAKAAHGGEALLAVLAIILWHFYHVHISHFNKSMFNGTMTETEMQHEHPAELAQIKAGVVQTEAPPEALRKRQTYFFPVAALIVVVFSYGLYKFVTFEQTAIATVPRGETAPVFVPITPTPTPTLIPSPTPLPDQAAIPLVWQDGVSALLENKCASCHIQNTFGGLNLSTYQSALEGGSRGPAVVPGDPQASVLVQIQQAGGHPGQLSQDELNAVIEWIQAGAPER